MKKTIILTITIIALLATPLFAQRYRHQSYRMDNLENLDDLKILIKNSATVDSILSIVRDITSIVNTDSLLIITIGDILTCQDSTNAHQRVRITQAQRERGNAPANRRNTNISIANRNTNRNTQRNTHRMERLNLTPQQNTKIQTLRQNFERAVADQNAEIEKLKIDKETALRNQNIRQAKSVVDKISKAEATIEKLRIDLRANISRELTPEQREQYQNRTRRQ